MTVDEVMRRERISVSADCTLIEGRVFTGVTFVLYDQHPRTGEESWGKHITRRVALYRHKDEQCIGSLVVDTRRA